MTATPSETHEAALSDELVGIQRYSTPIHDDIGMQESSDGEWIKVSDLLARTQPSAGEVVAWQLWTGEEGSGFTVETERWHAEQFIKEGGKATPLYATPPDQSKRVETKTALPAQPVAVKVVPDHPEVSGSIPAHAKWCQPGDMQDKRYFIVKFEDRDRGDALFTDEAEAREFYARATVSWNCWLFGALPALAAPSQQEGVTEEKVEAAKKAIRKALTDNLQNLDTLATFDVDILLRGCEHAMHTRGYEKPAEVADTLATAAARAVLEAALIDRDRVKP